VFVLAGVLATAEAWERFSEEWAVICDQEPKTPDFHMSLAYRLKGRYWGRGTDEELVQRRDDRLLELASAIQRHALLRVASGTTWRAYEAAARGRVPREIDQPYFFLFLRIIRLVARWQAETGRREKVDFVFDDQSKIGIEAVGWYPYFLETLNDHERFILSESPIFRHDKDLPPLKAADMCAWYHRREVVDRNAHLRRNELYERPKPMNVLWQLPYAVVNLTEDDLNRIIAAAK
jgi:hypothetical protein